MRLESGNSGAAQAPRLALLLAAILLALKIHQHTVRFTRPVASSLPNEQGATLMMGFHLELILSYSPNTDLTL
ncbi:hypothetical protein C1H71_18280 [Iodobacter fluviatilis]|uniref:Uncharacterized protein n=1 Tax=Iodobacter fluviatilis TaxID=537 RepID=A0A7G3GDP8_9NEIS|nr:hypothetical protein C1H71_18280 [Iodobacter fluviatilis]